MKALIIPPTGSARVQRITEDQINEIIGAPYGYLEGITLSSRDYAFVHEEGKLLDLPVNRNATVLRSAVPFSVPIGVDWIAGTMVIVGRKGAEPADVTKEMLSLCVILGIEVTT